MHMKTTFKITVEALNIAVSTHLIYLQASRGKRQGGQSCKIKSSGRQHGADEDATDEQRKLLCSEEPPASTIHTSVVPPASGVASGVDSSARRSSLRLSPPGQQQVQGSIAGDQGQDEGPTTVGRRGAPHATPEVEQVESRTWLGLDEGAGLLHHEQPCG